MDKALNKIIIGFMILVVFDATSFNIEKQRFGLLNSVLSTVQTIKKTVSIFN